MKTIKGRKKLHLFTCGVLMILTVTLFLPYKHAIIFEQENSGKILAYIPTHIKEESFQIKYTHSIHLTDVIETYEISDRNIVQKELAYSNFAIGMPSNAVDEGEVFIEKNGHYVITNMNRVFPFIDLRIGKVISNHTIRYREKSYRLHTFLGKGTWVRIKVKRISLWDELKGVNVIHER